MVFSSRLQQKKDQEQVPGSACPMAAAAMIRELAEVLLTLPWEQHTARGGITAQEFTRLLGQVSHDHTSLTRPRQCQNTPQAKLLQHGQVFKATLKAVWLGAQSCTSQAPKTPSSLTVFLAPERQLGTEEDFARSPSLQDRKLPRLEFSTERSSQEPGFFSGLFANTWDFYTEGKFHFPSCGLQI